MKKYKITVKRKGHPDIVQDGYDRLNSIIIPAELRMAYKKLFDAGIMSVQVDTYEE